MHQRSCRVIHSLNDELLTDLEQQSIEDSTGNTSTHSTCEETDVLGNIASDQNFRVLKKGVKLPKATENGQRLTAISNLNCD